MAAPAPPQPRQPTPEEMREVQQRAAQQLRERILAELAPTLRGQRVSPEDLRELLNAVEQQILQGGGG